jgi:hypothetical protein
MEALTEDAESAGVKEEDDDIVDAIFGRSQVYEQLQGLRTERRRGQQVKLEHRPQPHVGSI